MTVPYGLRSIAIAIAVLTSLAATACRAETSPPGWPAIVAAAKKEGRVVLYTNSVPSINARLKSGFEAANPGITLEFVRLVGLAAGDKLTEERQADIDGGDVVITSEIRWFTESAKAGLFKPAAGPHAETWPSAYMLPSGVPIVGLQAFIMVYNTSLATGPIDGYADLLRPEFKGRIGTTELASSASVVAWYDWLERTQGPDFLARLAAQQPRTYLGAQQGTQAAASGEVAIAPFSVMAVAGPLIATGAPLKIVLPRPMLGNPYGAAVVTWARRPDAALVFLDYLMSVQGQTDLSGKGELASPLRGIPGSGDARLITPYDAEKYGPDFIKAYTEKWTRLFRQRP